MSRDIKGGEAAFAEYFRRNYPGPDTIIGNPDWHAPKIYRAAVRAYRDATNASADEVTKLRELVDLAASIFTHCDVTDGVCCCGDSMAAHAAPLNCGHSPVDQGANAVDVWAKKHAALSPAPVVDAVKQGDAQ